MNLRLSTLTGPTVLALLVLSSCGSENGSTAEKKIEAPQAAGKLKGGGATLPLVAYSQWMELIPKEERGIQVSYQPSSSAEGVKQFLAGQLDFAGTDMPLTDEELAKAAVKPVHLPTLISAIVPVYNLAGVKEDVKFTGDVLGKIFAGKITRWNDPALAKINSGVELPAAPIVVFHRAQGSGASYALARYLVKVSPDFKKLIGPDGQVKWAGGKSVATSEEMASAVKSTANAIGYTDLNYARKAGLSFGKVENAAGKFTKANLETVGAAADAVKDVPEDFRMDISNGPGENMYPIATYTYLLVPGQIENVDRRTLTRRFLQWVFDRGEKTAMELDYGILPPAVLRKVEARIDNMR